MTTVAVRPPAGPGWPGVMPSLSGVKSTFRRETIEFVFRGEVARRLPGWRFRWAPSGAYQGEATGPSGDTYDVTLAWPEGTDRASWSSACDSARLCVQRMVKLEAENG